MTSRVTGHKPTPSERAIFAAARARIADISPQISELEGSRRSLKQEQELAQGRLDAYAYPVLTLPNEIISEIFVHFLQPYPKRPPIVGLLSPTMLGQICRQWRDITLSTPALWRAVGLFLQRGSRLREQIPLLEKFLKRSGALPLSIKL
ncbi:hypothetical protein DFH09DRAFT_919534, partial [Mycena vulgaris]